MVIIYGVILSLFFGIIVSGQILGFLGLYQTVPAILLAIISTLTAAFLFFKEIPTRKRDISDKNSHSLHSNTWLEASFFIAGAILLLFLIVLPTLRYPMSPVGRALTWDAGAYHFPKAVELYRSGSVWDLSVPYGDYPFGYESLLSFDFLLSGDERLFGATHLLIALLFVCVFWNLTRRYSRLPGGFLFFLGCVLLCMGSFGGEGKTILITGYALTIGKNDFLLGAAMLAIILHSPVGARSKEKDSPDELAEGSFQPLSMGMATMLALSVKPNAIGIVAVLWLYAAYQTHRSYSKDANRGAWRDFFLASFLAIPGILWAIRNMIVLGVIFTPAASTLQKDSIAYNLGNPFLYHFNFQFIMLTGTLFVLLAAFIGLRRIKSISPSIVGILALLFVSFMITPASAFQRVRDVPAHIAWRFGIALMVYCSIVVLLMFEKPLLKIFEFLCKQRWVMRTSVLAALGVVTVVMLWRGWWMTAYEPQNGWILRDQFSEAVGVDGYWSAYDYVQKNIRGAVIHIENGLAYYLYGPGFTNTPTKLQYPLEMEDKVPQPVPDYFTIFRPDWEANDGSGEFPAVLNSEEWQQKWKLVYDDNEGRVYKKNSN